MEDDYFWVDAGVVGEFVNCEEMVFLFTEVISDFLI